MANEILEHRGASWRSNKNAGMLIAADGPAIAKARATARTLAALRDLTNDRHRLNRFNTEQREQLAKRMTGTEERLPQQVTMAYRHLLLLGEGNGGGPKLDHVDLGPARVDVTIGGRVLDYLRSADRLVETTLAPAALLAARFGLLPEDTDAVELDRLLGFFYQLPRLPKIAGPNVLRQALVDGVKQGLFGLASGSNWDADESLLRFNSYRRANRDPVPAGHVARPRVSDRRGSIAAREPQQTPFPVVTTPPTQVPGGPPPSREGPVAAGGAGGTEGRTPVEPAALPGLTLRVRGVPGSKARDVIKVAVLPLTAASPEVTLDVVIRAEGGMSGIPRETLNLVVLEGLRQLGLQDFTVETDSKD